MDLNSINTTMSLSTYVNPTLTWCLIMPLVHLLSLFSNILCIIVFCSKTFIHKPIAIYFICLLISDSTTLLIGYIEMLDRETAMVDKSSLLCFFNQRIIHTIVDSVYAFMSRFCLEWILYKVLWTRASTILLAILSIQRSRTFFSLSYRETRCCALFACIISIFIAMFITCLEWTGIQCEKSKDPAVYMNVLTSIMKMNSSKVFFEHHIDENRLCLRQYFNQTSQLHYDCSLTDISNEFHSLTQSLVSHHDTQIVDGITSMLLNIQGQTHDDMTIKLFDKRPCQIKVVFSFCVKFYEFFHSLTFGFNRHTLAIFFGNALPSFTVVLANLLSLKVIYFSKSLKYLKQRTVNSRRHRRLQNDLRAFSVILVESFSVITISWGIPIFLTMFHCQTLYVVSMSACPQIKRFLAFFLFTDLFNSSTNALLYSLSGKLFRRRFISILKCLFACRCCFLWSHKRGLSFLPAQQLELRASSEPSVTSHYGTTLVNSPYRCQEQAKFRKGIKMTLKPKISDENASLTIVKLSDENETELERDKQTDRKKKLTARQRFEAFLISKMPWFASRKKRITIQHTSDSSLSSMSSAGIGPRTAPLSNLNRQHSTRKPNSDDIQHEKSVENVTAV